jgi:hypothetical protein
MERHWGMVERPEQLKVTPKTTSALGSAALTVLYVSGVYNLHHSLVNEKIFVLKVGQKL